MSLERTTFTLYFTVNHQAMLPTGVGCQAFFTVPTSSGFDTSARAAFGAPVAW